MARLGVVCQSDLINRLKFSEGQNSNDLVLDNRETCLSQLRSQVLPGDSHLFLAGNVPLATSINSMPFHSLDAPLKKLAVSNDRQFIAVLDTDNNIKVFYLANWLKIIIDHKFNQQPKSNFMSENAVAGSA